MAPRLLISLGLVIMASAKGTSSPPSTNATTTTGSGLSAADNAASGGGSGSRSASDGKRRKLRGDSTSAVAPARELRKRSQPGGNLLIGDDDTCLAVGDSVEVFLGRRAQHGGHTWLPASVVQVNDNRPPHGECYDHVLRELCSGLTRQCPVLQFLLVDWEAQRPRQSPGHGYQHPAAAGAQPLNHRTETKHRADCHFLLQF